MHEIWNFHTIFQQQKSKNITNNKEPLQRDTSMYWRLNILATQYIDDSIDLNRTELASIWNLCKNQHSKETLSLSLSFQAQLLDRNK